MFFESSEVELWGFVCVCFFSLLLLSDNLLVQMLFFKDKYFFIHKVINPSIFLLSSACFFTKFKGDAFHVISSCSRVKYRIG